MIRIVDQPLLALPVDAVVRAADEHLRPVGQISETIDRLAGDRFNAERRLQAALEVGAAVITSGGDLAAEFVLHVVIQSDDRAVTRDTVRRALTSAWHRAEGWQLTTVAAALSGFGLSPEHAAVALVETFRDRPESTGFPAELHIVVESPEQRGLGGALHQERKSVNRRSLAAIILTCWLGSLGWLVQRHYLQATPRDQVPRWPVPPGASFRTVRLGDRQYGVASLAVDTVGEGLRVTELLTIDLPSLQPKTPRRTSIRVEAMYTRALQLMRWQSDMLGEHGRVTAVGVVSGDTLLTVINTPRGEPAETLSLRLRRPIVLPSAMPLVAASRGLPRPGSKLNIEVYDPLDEELRIEHLTVAAESVFTVTDSAEYNETLGRWRIAHSDTVRAWRIDAVEHGLGHASWVDAAGMTVREDHALGARLDRTAFEIANTNFRGLPPPLWDTSVAAPRYTFAEGSSPPRQEMIVLAHLAPADPLPSVVPALVGGWQERSRDTLTIRPRAAEDSVRRVSRRRRVADRCRLSRDPDRRGDCAERTDARSDRPGPRRVGEPHDYSSGRERDTQRRRHPTAPERDPGGACVPAGRAGPRRRTGRPSGVGPRPDGRSVATPAVGRVPESRLDSARSRHARARTHWSAASGWPSAGGPD